MTSWTGFGVVGLVPGRREIHLRVAAWEEWETAMQVISGCFEAMARRWR